MLGVIGINYSELNQMTPALVFKIVDKHREHHENKFKQDYELTRLMVNAWGGKLKSYDELTSNNKLTGVATVKIIGGNRTDPV